MDARALLLLFTMPCLLIAAGAENTSDFLGQNRCFATIISGEDQLDAQTAGEINDCLLSASDAECDVFRCLINTTCHLEDDLYEICKDFFQTLDNFDTRGKQFIKDFLKCNIIGLRTRCSSSVDRCAEVQRILIHVQGSCYQQNNLCEAAATNIDAFVNMLDFNKLLSNGAYMEYVKFLFDCGNNITEAIRSRLRTILDTLKLLLEDSCIIVEDVTTQQH